jgi:hypothetical protein
LRWNSRLREVLEFNVTPSVCTLGADDAAEITTTPIQKTSYGVNWSHTKSDTVSAVV